MTDYQKDFLLWLTRVLVIVAVSVLCLVLTLKYIELGFMVVLFSIINFVAILIAVKTYPAVCNYKSVWANNGLVQFTDRKKDE